MNIKYQVFVSSTYEDLKKERDQAIKAILEMGHIPVGMEMFSAADEEQWKLITRQIDQSDYYVVIVAHRYGSMVEGVSYTEKEYDYAVKQGVPVLGFVIDEAVAWPPDWIDRDPAKQGALINFKSKVKRRPVGFWSSAGDLHGKLSISLMKAITTNPRPGWARATEIAGPEVITELSRLSRENASLRERLATAEHKAKDDELAEREKMIRILEANSIDVRIMYEGSRDWGSPISKNLLNLFDILAPEMVVEKSTDDAAAYVALMMDPDRGAKRKTRTIPTNALKYWLSDLMTLGLVEPSSRRHSVKDTNEYWTLTGKGRDVLQVLRLRRLERGNVGVPVSG